MELLEREFTEFLCHDCHKRIEYDDYAISCGIDPGSEWDEDECVLCVIPKSPVDPNLMLSPLYKCKCDNIILIYVPKMFQCEKCMEVYNLMIAHITDIAHHNQLLIDKVRELDMFEPNLPCQNNHNTMINNETILHYITYFTGDSVTPNSDIANNIL